MAIVRAKSGKRAKGQRQGRGGEARSAKPSLRHAGTEYKALPAKQNVRRSGRGRGRSEGGSIFVMLEKADGCAAVVRVGERVGRVWDEGSHVFTVRLPGQGTQGTALVGRQINALRRMHRVFGAVGHLQRGKILLKLLEGPATYRALRTLTGLKAGPLYHHVNQLRLAGLVLPKQRDLYELSRAGRNLIVVAVALEPLTRDTRRRPLLRSR